MSEQFLLFEVCGRRLVLRVRFVREVLRCVALSPPVDETSRLEGYLNLRARTVPVVDLRAALGLAPKAVSAADLLIVVEHQNALWALRADGGLTIHELADDAIEPDSSHPLTPESVRIGEHVAFVVDPSRFERQFRTGDDEITHHPETVE